MPSYYLYTCKNCGYERERYRNVKKCPRCNMELNRKVKAKLPLNPYVGKQVAYLQESDAYYRCQQDMLQFFDKFLQEHIELNKERRWDTTLMVALQINFRNRFMDKK